jgi:hypothetical protein
MPNPVQASFDPALCSLTDGVSPEENDVQMCLSPLAPLANGAQTAAPSPSAPSGSPPSPAVSVLVSRFTTPTGTHPPVEPSLGKAIVNCGWEEANFAGTAAGIIIAAPETLGASLLAAFRLTTGAGLIQRCINRDEAQQVQDGTRENLAADCRNEGAIPITTTDGAVLCAK